MALALYKSNRPISEQVETIDLDVTPVMNMFVILIPFLVSMAVFANLSIIEFSLPPNAGTEMNNEEQKPKPKLTLRIGADYFGIVLGDTLYDSLHIEADNYPFDLLRQRLKERKVVLEVNNDIVIASRDEFPFKYVVQVMDICRDVGFSNVGLSSVPVTSPGPIQ